MSSVLDKVGFRNILSTLAGQQGLTDFATGWGNDPQKMVSDVDRAKVSLLLTGLSAVGVDEHRRYLSPPGYPAGTFVVTEVGNRDVKIRVLVEAYDASVEASEITDAIRTGIRADAINQALNAINLALEWAGPTILLPTIYDNRVVSAATCEFTFGGVALQTSAVTPPGVGGDYIATIDGNNIVPGTLTP